MNSKVFGQVGRSSKEENCGDLAYFLLTISAYTYFHVGLSLASAVGFLEHVQTELA